LVRLGAPLARQVVISSACRCLPLPPRAAAGRLAGARLPCQMASLLLCPWAQAQSICLDVAFPKRNLVRSAFAESAAECPPSQLKPLLKRLLKAWERAQPNLGGRPVLERAAPATVVARNALDQIRLARTREPVSQQGHHCAARHGAGRQGTAANHRRSRHGSCHELVPRLNRGSRPTAPNPGPLARQSPAWPRLLRGKQLAARMRPAPAGWPASGPCRGSSNGK